MTEETTATTETTQTVIQEIADKIDQIDENVRAKVTDEALQKLIATQLETMLKDDPEFARKMRFGEPEGEQKLVGSKFHRWGLGISDVEYLYDVAQATHRFNPTQYKGPSEELENAYQAISEAFYLPEEEVQEIDKRAIDNLFPRIPKALLSKHDAGLQSRGKYEEMDAYKRSMAALEYQENVRANDAMDTAETGYGLQLIGAQYVRELWEAARRESRIFNLLTPFEMTDPTAYLPVEADIPEMLFVPESTASNSSDYATVLTGSNRVQVDAKKFVIHQMWSGELEEDSIIPFVPFLRRQSVLSLAHYSDSLVLNGDTVTAATGNINSDDEAPAATKHYLAFDGLRKVGLVDNTNNQADMAGVITWAALVTAFSRMVDLTYLMDWGHPTNSGDLVQICDPFTADKIGQLDEVVTWKQYGTKPLVVGQVAEVLGHPVIGSMAMGLTEADGKISFDTPANNVKGQLTTFNRRGFVPGWRRRVKTEVERLPATDQTRLVLSLRLGFGRFSPTGAVAGIEATDTIFNITVA
jgi:HK97 family phage major capsid protein